MRYLATVHFVPSGIPLPDVAEWLGHSRNFIKVTMHYACDALANAVVRAKDLLEARRAREQRQAQG